ncbi:MAG: extracellular solute-binding protein [Spirochaetales bacterium]|nr:extracellular solute-binding protein [Spirochaetales bacterium]
MKRKFYLCFIMLIIFALIPASVFAGGQAEGTSETAEKPQESAVEKPLTYWTAGGDFYKAEKIAIDSFNKKNPDSPVIYNPIPAGSSSEMIIQTAIATSTAPTITANLEVFFANFLAENDVLVALDTLPGFNELVKSRSSEGFMDSIRSADGHIYVLPQMWTPALLLYDNVMLKKAGFDKPPVTYSEFNEFASKVIEMGDCIAIDFDPIAAWWKLGYYWHTFYMSAKGNVQELSKDGLDTKSDVSVAFVEFVANAFKKGYASTDRDRYKFNQHSNVGCMACAGSGAPKGVMAMRPDAELTLAPPPVPDFIGTNEGSWVDASVKGLAIIKNSGNVEKAWEYIKWRFSNPEFDLELMNKTSLLPMRSDLMENPVFKDYFETHAYMDVFADFVPRSHSVLCPDKYDIYNAVKKALWEPIAYQKKDVNTALRDAEIAVQAVLAK